MAKTIILCDSPLPGLAEHRTVIGSSRFLAESPTDAPAGAAASRPLRVINLCHSAHYLDAGYYCSLLGEARGHQLLPSVTTLNDLYGDCRYGLRETRQDNSAATHGPAPAPERILIMFGVTQQPKWQRLAKRLFERYPSPLLQLVTDPERFGHTAQVQALPVSALSAPELARLVTELERFIGRAGWPRPAPPPRLRWKMAILINPAEGYLAPSDAPVLARMVRAAARFDIAAELITAEHMGIATEPRLTRYDALFLRETTAIHHHTYRLARQAEQAGMVVLDDSRSILRCCNKIFLYETFVRHGIAHPKTRVIHAASETEIEQIEREFAYPLVIKQAESANSSGVFKVANRRALQQKLAELLAQDTLLLAQEYLYTDFDWRIGVLNNQAIFSCRYLMARNYWKIYNSNSKRFCIGGHESMALSDTPPAVIEAALAACRPIGNGLYGVDLKQIDERVLVIEINDSTNIEHGVEDAIEGERLYDAIMSEFARRLKQGAA